MLDRTYCASPACTGKCGRRPSDGELIAFAINGWMPSWAYFCDERGEPVEVKASAGDGEQG